MGRKNASWREIAIVTNFAGASGRDHLAGVFKYVNTGRPWRLRLPDSTSELLESIRAGTRTDGVVTTVPDGAEVRAALTGSGIPCVIAAYPPPGRPAHVSYVHLDDEAIGRAALQHFLSRGNFNSFAFVTDEPRLGYSQGRAAGFAAALGAHGQSAIVLELPERDEGGREAEAVMRKLNRLQRPAAVFAARDRAALKVMDMCRTLKLEVPAQVAVLGVDNDELICCSSSPRISSILPDHVGVGFRAARELDRLLDGGAGVETVLSNPVSELFLRDSTRVVPPTARLVAEALSFIEKNASGGLRVTDVVRHLGVSRRLADLRFRQIRHETILDAITRTRVGLVKRRLMASSDSMSRIAMDCGFSSISALSRFFARETGRTMSEWRADAVSRR